MVEQYNISWLNGGTEVLNSRTSWWNSTLSDGGTVEHLMCKSRTSNIGTVELSWWNKTTSDGGTVKQK